MPPKTQWPATTVRLAHDDFAPCIFWHDAVDGSHIVIDNFEAYGELVGSDKVESWQVSAVMRLDISPQL